MKVTTIFAFTLLGFAATIGQILVLRELLTVFSGTELAVAIVLAAWLFWTALGGLLEEQLQVGRIAGLVYGVDLLGSFLGCLLVGLVFIPFLGILQSLVILALVNITAVLPLTVSQMRLSRASSGQQAGSRE